MFLCGYGCTPCGGVRLEPFFTGKPEYVVAVVEKALGRGEVAGAKQEATKPAKGRGTQQAQLFALADELAQLTYAPRERALVGGLGFGQRMHGSELASAFASLRANDLVWNYVVNNYLKGETPPAFDLLHWNGDVTNLPSKWHNDYLRDLYRDNKLVVADALEADGTPIDLTRVSTPTFVQAGREDHIAPAESVWRITRHFTGPMEFLLAGSGHIAGVVNPPEANKYQYWTNDKGAPTVEEWLKGATEHPGSWWPDWAKWMADKSGPKVKAPTPGSGKLKVIEDAPGTYVRARAE